MALSDPAEAIAKSIELWPCNPGIALSSIRIRLLSLYIDELVKWNRKMNLTGLRSKETNHP